MTKISQEVTSNPGSTNTRDGRIARKPSRDEMLRLLSQQDNIYSDQSDSDQSPWDTNTHQTQPDALNEIITPPDAVNDMPEVPSDSNTSNNEPEESQGVRAVDQTHQNADPELQVDDELDPALIQLMEVTPALLRQLDEYFDNLPNSIPEDIKNQTLDAPPLASLTAPLDVSTLPHHNSVLDLTPLTDETDEILALDLSSPPDGMLQLDVSTPPDAHQEFDNVVEPPEDLSDLRSFLGLRTPTDGGDAVMANDDNEMDQALDAPQAGPSHQHYGHPTMENEPEINQVLEALFGPQHSNARGTKRQRSSSRTSVNQEPPQAGTSMLETYTREQTDSR